MAHVRSTSMRYLNDLPAPMRDGVRFSADMWMRTFEHDGGLWRDDDARWMGLAKCQVRRRVESSIGDWVQIRAKKGAMR